MPVLSFGGTRRRVVTIAIVLAVVAAITTWVVVTTTDSGAAAQSANSRSHSTGTLAPGFHAPDVKTFFSGQVVEPNPETWTDVRPPAGYKVLVLVQGADGNTPRDPQVKILLDATKRWARDEDHVDLTIRYLGDPHTYIDEIDRAAKSHEADMIVTAGNGLVDPVAVVSANYAGENPQQFLVLGAEVAEPTTNIAATDWQGSSYLGEGAPEADYYDPAAVTAPRAYAALRAGAAAVLTGYTSVIVRIPADRY